MTFKEKLKKEQPNMIDDRCKGGCCGCPFKYGYEPADKKPCDRMDCYTCWNREMPETENPSIKPDLNALVERAATKKDISLLIHINGNDTTISVYPCPDPSEKKGNPVAEAYKLLVQANLRDENNLVCAVSNAADLLKEALEC